MSLIKYIATLVLIGLAFFSYNLLDKVFNYPYYVFILTYLFLLTIHLIIFIKKDEIKLLEYQVKFKVNYVFSINFLSKFLLFNFSSIVFAFIILIPVHSAMQEGLKNTSLKIENAQIIGLSYRHYKGGGSSGPIYTLKLKDKQITLQMSDPSLEVIEKEGVEAHSYYVNIYFKESILGTRVIKKIEMHHYE